ncbi:MAG: undecaprenyl-diphosphate phosphatase [Planctomycetota bacterium]|jgi:undecaprenyl-diphosphatase|nr:undecaprenyl-diphosphate phosphatase [Planctomycetota bacterium]
MGASRRRESDGDEVREESRLIFRARRLLWERNVGQVADIASIGYVWAAILGLIQGLTEFLPVSSSGHLAMAGHVGFGMPAGPELDAFLHLATLLTVFIYFRSAIIRCFREDRRVLAYIVVASIPTGVIGLLCKDYFEALRLSPNMICAGFMVTAAALSMAELSHGGNYRLRGLGGFGAFFIGLCQTLAISPGISRSGSTISGAMLCGIDKEEAFAFSFILSIPAVFGAASLHAYNLCKERGGPAALFAGQEWGPLLTGFVVAAVTGFVALSLLDWVVVRGKLAWFAAYCLLAAGAGFVYFNFVR